MKKFKEEIQEMNPQQRWAFMFIVFSAILTLKSVLTQKDPGMVVISCQLAAIYFKVGGLEE